MITDVLIRIEGSDLPGRTCGPGPDYPRGHHNIHVAVQGRKGQQDLLGRVPADVAAATWQLDCDILSVFPSLEKERSRVYDRRSQTVDGSLYVGVATGPTVVRIF